MGTSFTCPGPPGRMEIAHLPSGESPPALPSPNCAGRRAVDFANGKGIVGPGGFTGIFEQDRLPVALKCLWRCPNRARKDRWSCRPVPVVAMAIRSSSRLTSTRPSGATSSKVMPSGRSENFPSSSRQIHGVQVAIEAFFDGCKPDFFSIGAPSQAVLRFPLGRKYAVTWPLRSTRHDRPAVIPQVQGDP